MTAPDDYRREHGFRTDENGDLYLLVNRIKRSYWVLLWPLFFWTAGLLAGITIGLAIA